MTAQHGLGRPESGRLRVLVDGRCRWNLLVDVLGECGALVGHEVGRHEAELVLLVVLQLLVHLCRARLLLLLAELVLA